MLSKCSITEVECRSKKCIFCVTCLSFSLTFIFEIEHIFFMDALDTFCYEYLLWFIIYKQYRQIAQSTRPQKKVSSNNSNSFTNNCLRSWCSKTANRHILSLCQISLKHIFHRFGQFFLYKVWLFLILEGNLREKENILKAFKNILFKNWTLISWN